MPRRTIRLLLTPESHYPVEVEKREVFNNCTMKKLGLSTFKPSREEAKEDLLKMKMKMIKMNLVQCLK